MEGDVRGRDLDSEGVTVDVLEFRVKIPSLTFSKIESFGQATLFDFEVIKLAFILLNLVLELLPLFSRHHLLDRKRLLSLLYPHYFGLVGLPSSHECYFSFFSENDIRFLNLPMSLSNLSVKAVVDKVNVYSTLSFFAWIS